MPKAAAIRLKYFPVNAAWAFIFGRDLRTAQVITMCGEGRMFQKRTQAVAAAKRCSLKVDRRGAVK